MPTVRWGSFAQQVPHVSFLDILHSVRDVKPRNVKEAQLLSETRRKLRRFQNN